jgi:hypothetical protein
MRRVASAITNEAGIGLPESRKSRPNGKFAGMTGA